VHHKKWGEKTKRDAANRSHKTGLEATTINKKVGHWEVVRVRAGAPYPRKIEGKACVFICKKYTQSEKVQQYFYLSRWREDQD